MTITKEDIHAALARLTEWFPQTFVLEKYLPHRPLKVGIHPDILVRRPALILHHNDETTELQDREMRRAMAAVRYAFPEAYESMRLSANDVRRFLKQTGRSRDGYQSLKDIPVISLGQPDFLRALKSFATKLFRALHYKHAERIVPSSGVVAGWFFSNVQVMDGVIPRDILKIVGREPNLKRANNNLTSQFGYLHQVAQERTSSVFLCGFRKSFAMIGYVSAVDDLEPVFDENLDRGRFRSKPFSHP
jgi:hypothetical protein